MWHAFYGCEEEDDAAFEARVNSLAREIGDRGKPIPEAVPPPAAAAPARPKPTPAPAPAPEPAPAPATPRPVAQTAAVATPNRSFSPTMHQQSPPPAAAMQLQHGASGSFAELSAFMKEMLERDDRAKQEMEAKLEEKLAQAKQEARAEKAALMAEMAKLREQMTPSEPPPAVPDEALAALQARLEAMHAAGLLSDDELFAAEDLCADFSELQASVPNGGALTEDAIYRGAGLSYASAAKLHKLAAVGQHGVGRGVCAPAAAQVLVNRARCT